MTERVERLRELLKKAEEEGGGCGVILGCGCCATENGYEVAKGAVNALPALLRLYDAAKQLLELAESAQVQHSSAEYSMHDDCPQCRILSNAKAALRELEREGGE